MKTVILDCETTGLPPKGANYETDWKYFPRILSIAWKVNDQPTVENIIAQNGFIIPPEATKINGITQQMVDESPYQLEGVLIELIETTGIYFVAGFNLYFDTSNIKANILRLISEERVTQEFYDKAVNFLHKDKRIDVMRACHKLFGGKWPTLSEAYTRLFQESFDAHSAGSDVDATYRILNELIRLGAVKLPETVKVVEEEI